MSWVAHCSCRQEHGCLKTENIHFPKLPEKLMGSSSTTRASQLSFSPPLYIVWEKGRILKFSLSFTKRRLTDRISRGSFVSDHSSSASRWQSPVPTSRKQLYYLLGPCPAWWIFARIKRSYLGRCGRKYCLMPLLKSHLFSFLLCLFIESSLCQARTCLPWAQPQE